MTVRLGSAMGMVCGSHVFNRQQRIRSVEDSKRAKVMDCYIWQVLIKYWKFVEEIND